MQTGSEAQPLRSQIVTSKGGRRYLPYAFTEQGVAMLSSILRSQRAVEVNIAIMRTFVQLRRLMNSNRDLAQKIGEMEDKYDGSSASFSMPFASSSVCLPSLLTTSVSTPSRPPSPRKKPAALARKPEIRSRLT